MKETYEFKEKCASIYEQEIITDKNLNELEDTLTNLMTQIDIHNPKNFAYFYEIQVCINKYFNEILAKKYRTQKIPKIQKPKKQQYA